MAKKKAKIKGSYGPSDVNKAREMIGEGKSSNATQPYARGGRY